eukprot:COSAG05_NODE_57_length_23291_cov_75.862668_7_plen_41_part_00
MEQEQAQQRQAQQQQQLWPISQVWLVAVQQLLPVVAVPPY